jgi:tetratricopeptide (TPR) repeat protein
MCRNVRYIVLLFLLPFALLCACQRYDTDPVETHYGTSRIEQAVEPVVAETNRTMQVPEPVAAERSRSIETPSKQVVEPVETPSHLITPSPELSAIDSLMWHQPDSALARLIPYLDTCTTTEYNRHYANLLLSELLYKNDYAQTNRPALLQAMRYFDSLTLILNDTPKPKRLIAGTDPLSLTRNDNLAFLEARSHYINGVGYYENDSVVEACKEYLKALELMEDHFEEKELVGEKARFMTYTYNRLTELFSDQFMMETAIVYGEKALQFCMLEPASPLGASRILYQIGKQYDKLEELDKAKQYYNRALESMANTDNLVYRDIVASKALCEYDAGGGMEQSLEELRRVVILADTDDERLNRFLTMGGIFYEERVYDSAIKYLEPVFNGSNSIVSKIQAADCLRIMYDRIGNGEKSDGYIRFLADHKKLEGEHKALVSKLGELSKIYLNQKQEKEAEKARKKDVKKAVGIIIPFAIMIVLAILILAKLRGMKRLKEQQKEAKEAFEEAEKQHELTLQRQQTEAETLLEEKERQLEKERKARQREKEKLQQGLRQREEQVSALEKALGSQREEVELRREAFMNEAICRKINDSVRSLRITARNSHEKYVSFTEEDAAALKAAVLKHYGNFESVLLGKYPKMGNDDLQLCQLYLMGLDERQIAVLQNKSYSAIKKRVNNLKDLLGLDENLQSYLLKFSSFQET